MGGKGERVFRNNFKTHMDKTKGGVESGEEGGNGWGWGGVVGGKGRQLYLNNNKIKKNNGRKKHEKQNFVT